MKSFVLLAVCVLSLALGSRALADGLAITPLRAVLSTRVQTAGFTLISQEPNPTLVQVHLFAWTQQNGVDQLVPSDDLLVGPPIFTIQPGQTQLIRIGLRNQPASQREVTYRIIIAEVPVRPRADNGINFAFRLSMPIFVTPDKPGEVSLHWSAVKVEASHMRLTVEDAGDRHVQVRSLRVVTAPRGDLIFSLPTAAYVLAGQNRSWMLRLNKVEASSSIRISAQTDHGPIEQTIDVHAP